MVKHAAKLKIGLAILLVILLVLLLVNACDIGPRAVENNPVGIGILAPEPNALVVARMPVQIQTAFENPDEISRVELLVEKADQSEPAMLLRSDTPTDPTVTQQWIPEAPGGYTVRVKAIGFDNNLIEERARPFTAIDMAGPIGSATIGVRFAAGGPDVSADISAVAFVVPYSLPEEQLPPSSPGCPVIESMQIIGADQQDITPGAAVNVEVEVGQPIQVSWTIANFSQTTVATIEVVKPDGTITRQAYNQSTVFTYTSEQTGPHVIRLRLVSDACQAGVQHELLVNVVDTATPISEPIVIVAEATPVPSPTPTPFFPPPPPVPGVPPGPTQAEIPAMSPPACDAAEYLGVYTGAGDTSERIFIPTDDQIPARVTAGTLVHRAWRLRNIGTCTWGPGYELAFYGGRSMGSGGVAFESFFPSEPARRNIVIEEGRLIAPEGKPNQTASLEVILNTPAIPGIHQSYWRLRNPQGVYFGPIVGVTLDVVRECEPKPGEPPIYGAPVVNSFRILGTNGALAPEGAGETLVYVVEAGQLVTLDWNIVNATNFQIVVKDPTGNIETISTPDPVGRANFTPTRVGEYTITLYVENGVCAYTKELQIFVVPPEDQQFILNIILSSASSSAAASADQPNVSASTEVASGNVVARWQHFDPTTDEFILLARREQRTRSQDCLVEGWSWTCRDVWSDWTPSSQDFSSEVGTSSTGRATITNLDTSLCQSSSTTVEYRVRYVMQARKNGQAANPEFSNQVYVACGSSASTTLPTEIE